MKNIFSKNKKIEQVKDEHNHFKFNREYEVSVNYLLERVELLTSKVNELVDIINERM